MGQAKPPAKKRNKEKEKSFCYIKDINIKCHFGQDKYGKREQEPQLVSTGKLDTRKVSHLRTAVPNDEFPHKLLAKLSR